MSAPLIPAFLDPGTLPVVVFPPTSRYAGTPTTTLALPDGSTVTYLRRRFVPHAEHLSLQQEHVVTQGERLDHVAAQLLGDAVLFWMVCDANDAMRPEDLEKVGRRLRIPRPETAGGGSA